MFEIMILSKFGEGFLLNLLRYRFKIFRAYSDYGIVIVTANTGSDCNRGTLRAHVKHGGNFSIERKIAPF